MIRAQGIASADLDIRKFVIRVAAEVGDVLGEQLAGIYLHGSLAGGSFFRHVSDIDMLILVDGALPANTLRALGEKLHELNGSRPSKGELEITVMQARHAKTYQHPAPVELQLNANPAAVPAQLLNARERSIRLTGDEPAYAIGIVPWYAFIAAVLAGFEEKAAALDSRPVSVILNACRTLHDATAPAMKVLSKPEAAQWALGVVPEEFKKLISDALDVHRENVSRSFDRQEIEALRAFVRAKSKASFDKARDTGEDDDE